jgi:hypothetical protein
MQKCDVTIARVYGFHDGNLVRIDIMDGRKLLGRVEMTMEKFAACLMGVGKTEATFTTTRRPQGAEPE